MYLLTAPPRTGKSTAIKKIVNMLGPNNCGGFYTEEIRKDGDRIGFKIISLNGKEGILADVDLDSPYKISKYGVNLEVFEDIGLKELYRAIDSKDINYLIIDEIGPMQLFSDEYKELLLKLLTIDKIVIGTIFYANYDWLDDYKKNKQIKLIEIDENNRNTIPLQIVEEVTKEDAIFQRKIQKAKNYILEPERFKTLDNKTIISSEHGIRSVEYKDNRYKCDCEYYKEKGTCSHIISTIIR